MANKALYLTGVQGEWKVGQRDIPTVRDGMVVVRTHAIALNPIDWKLHDHEVYPLKFPLVIGNDVAGVVEAVGKDVTAIKPGQRVFGFSAGARSGDDDQGTFQEYSLINSSLTMQIPDSMSFQEGAALPMGLFTAVGGLRELGVNLPGAPVGGEAGTKAVLIWGGASAVGFAAVQVARLAGVTIFTTASPQHHDKLRSLGAHHVFDYRSPAVAEDIKAAVEAAGLTVNRAFDAVSADLPTTARVLKGLGGGNITAVTQVEDEMPEGVKAWFSGARGTFSNPELANWLTHDYIFKAVQKGEFVPTKVEVVPGGLEGIGAGLAKLKAGVSGVKLVVDV